MKKHNLVQAACLLACAATPLAAQSQSGSPASAADTPEIIVTASRSEQVLQTAPVGATIITRAQIESSGVLDANEAIRKIGGVAARSDQNGGREYRLDLRGFGETADANTVVLVDGMRISENQQTPAKLSSIPASAIERIEILRGGSSVVWGEGATSGVIHVILRKDIKKGVSGSAGVALESFGGHDGQASLRVGSGTGAFDISASSAASNGYRENSRYTQDVAGMGLTVKEGALSLRTRLDTETAMNRWPGSLNYTNFANNPKQTTTAQNWGGLKQTKFNSGMDYRFGNWTAVIDFAVNRRATDAFFSGSAQATRSSDSTQFQPRAVYKGDVGFGILNTTIGFDSHRWNYFAQRVSDANYNTVDRTGQQNNRAVFVAADLLLPSQTRITLGQRTERVSKIARDSAGGTDTNALNNKVSASEMGVNQTLSKGLDAYARIAKSFRLANIDDYMATDVAIALRPQLSKDTELGMKLRQNGYGAAVRYFSQDTVDEIYYDLAANGGNGANVNIAPTSRKGIELQANASIGSAVTVSATLQSMKAVFSSGANAGKHIPLVNEQSASARIAYQMGAKQSIEGAWRMLGAARSGSDEANTCTKLIPSNRVLDGVYRWKDRGLELTFGVNNLTNKSAYNYDYNWNCGTGGVYPEPTRSFRATVKYNF